MRGEEESMFFLVPEQFDLQVGQCLCLLQPLLFAGCFIEREQSLHEEGIIIQVGIQPRLIGPIAAIQVPLIVAHLI